VQTPVHTSAYSHRRVRGRSRRRRRILLNLPIISRWQRQAASPGEGGADIRRAGVRRKGYGLANMLRLIVVVPAGPESVPGLAATFGSMTKA
jgi:hypothetical protein